MGVVISWVTCQLFDNDVELHAQRKVWMIRALGAQAAWRSPEICSYPLNASQIRGTIANLSGLAPRVGPLRLAECLRLRAAPSWVVALKLAGGTLISGGVDSGCFRTHPTTMVNMRSSSEALKLCSKTVNVCISPSVIQTSPQNFSPGVTSSSTAKPRVIRVPPTNISAMAPGTCDE